MIFNNMKREDILVIVFIPKTKEGKDKKRNTPENLNALYEGRK